MENKLKRIVVIASDHAGFKLKDALKNYLLSKEDLEVIDVGCDSAEKSVDYPDYAEKLCLEVLKNPLNRGIVVCGSGIGISIACNKINGIRCALLHEPLSARLTREHNDTNVMSLGCGYVGVDLAKNIVDVWLNTEFPGAPNHQRRIDKIAELEKKY